MQRRSRIRIWIVVFCFVILPAVFSYAIFRQFETNREINTQYYAGLLQVKLEGSGSTQMIRSWKEEEGENYFLFLPSHAETARVSFQPDVTDGLRIRIDGQQVEAGEDVKQLQKEVAHTLEFCSDQGVVAEAGTLTIYSSGQLASAYITTKTGSTNYIHSSQEAKEEGKLLVITPDGQVDYEGELSAVKGRGNATWDYPKKPYNIKLKQADSILGLQKSDQFSLLANWADKSFLRNKIAYDMAELAGLPGTPQADFIDLYLNGEYAGTYQLTEKITAPTHYLMEMEILERWQNEPKGIRTEAGQAVTVKEPIPISYDEVDEIGVKLQETEEAILAENGRNPVSGKHFTQLLDLDSWVKVYLVQEIMQNYDAYVSSLFMYMEDTGDSSVYCGPVWDFDWSLISRDGISEGVLTANQSRSPFTNYWLPSLYEKTEFNQELVRQYQELFLPMIEKITMERIAIYQQDLEASLAMNAARWKLEGTAAWKEEVGRVSNYLSERSARLLEIWTVPEAFHKVHVVCESDSFGTMDYYVKKGEYLEDLPEGLAKSGYQFEGWFDQETGQPFSVDSPIEQSAKIEARWSSTKDQSFLAALLDTGIFQVRYMLSAILVLMLLGFIILDLTKNGKKAGHR